MVGMGSQGQPGHTPALPGWPSVPLSGCTLRMPSAVWKAWNELGKSTSGSDSSTSASSASTASRTVIFLQEKLPNWACWVSARASQSGHTGGPSWGLPRRATPTFLLTKSTVWWECMSL